MKNQHIKKAEDALAGIVFGSTKDEAHSLGVCLNCKAQILGFDDELSEREYEISGLCQKCQNEIFEEDEV